MNHRASLHGPLCALVASLAVGAMGCLQELDTGAASSSGSSVLVQDAGVGANAGGDCNANGSCTSCDAGSFKQWAAGGGSFCQPIAFFTPAINLVNDNQNGQATDPCIKTQQESMQIRQTYCAGCHGSGAATYDFVLDDKKLTCTPSLANKTWSDGTPKRFIVPGNPERSWLYLRARVGLADSQSVAGMPPPGGAGLDAPLRPSISEIGILRAWIYCLAGSPLPGGPNSGCPGSPQDSPDAGANWGDGG
jgi:hypothetical protein